MNTLDVRAWGLFIGCGWGAVVFTLGMLSRFLNMSPKFVVLLGKVYIGYKNTVPGSFIGAVWGFADGAISGMLIAWLYNRIVL